MATSVAIDDRPSCFRFPRGNGLGVDLAALGVGKDFKGTAWEVSLRMFCAWSGHLMQRVVKDCRGTAWEVSFARTVHGLGI